MGRTLANTMINVGIQSSCDEAMYQVRKQQERSLTVTCLNSRKKVQEMNCILFFNNYANNNNNFARKYFH